MHSRAALLLLVVATSCAKHHPRAPSPIDVAPQASAPLASTHSVSATTTTSAATTASASGGKRTQLVSHMVNGHVEISEEPVVDAAADAPKDADAVAAVAVDAAARPVGIALPDDLSANGARSSMAKLLEAASAEPDASARLEKLEKLRATAQSPAVRAAIDSHIANAYEDQNDHANAISAWQRVNEEKPSANVEAHIASLEKKASAEKGFAHITHEHFEVHFEGDADRALAEQALDNLDEAWRTIGDKLDLHPPAPVLVIFYGGSKYQDATGAPDWSGGVFDGKIRVRENSLRISRGDVRDLLFHEYTHALLHTSVKGEIPAWMHEGLAQHMEPGITHARIDRLKKVPKEHLPRVAALRASFSRLDAQNADIAYGSAQDLVDMLADWRGERSFADLFASMNAGKPFDDAIDDVYSLTPDLVESRWKSRF